MQTIKCVVVGDQFVGKTNMLIRYTFDMFTGDYLPTNKSNFDNYESVAVIGEEEIKLDVFDTAGEDYFYRIREQIYQNVSVFLVCFSISQPWTFSNVKSKWIHELTLNNVNAPCILVGTKIDLRNDKMTLKSLEEKRLKPVSTSSGLQLAKDIKAVKYLECSSLTGDGIKEVFSEVARVGLLGRSHDKSVCDIL